MYLFIKHISLFVIYTSILCYTFLYSIPGKLVHQVVMLYILYYGVLIIPFVHKIYVYNVIERTIPKWSYIIRASVHYMFFSPILTKCFPSVLSVFIIMLWKDIYFLICHAEQRIAKIETALYEQNILHRVAHLHLNVFEDDMKNRFHKHCFDTNRLYLIDHTDKSREEMLGIYNYRNVRSEKKTPRKFYGKDETYYKASNNSRIFISKRYYFTVPPLCLLVWLMAMTDTSTSLIMYINHVVLLVDILSYYLGPITNDILVDVSYLIGIFCIICRK
mgnify:CR=1 FL=1